MVTIQELEEQLTKLNEDAIAIQARADQEKRDLTQDEREKLQDTLDRYDNIEEDIERRKRLEKQTRKTAQLSSDEPEDEKKETRKTAPGDPMAGSPGRRPEYAKPKDQSGRCGWRSMGEFAQTVALAGSGDGGSAARQMIESRAPTTYGTEGIGADGGFAVPPDFRTEIMQEVMGEDSLMARCAIETISGNSMTYPKDEDTPWSSSGVTAYWTGEASQLTESKPALEQSTITLHKLTCLVPVTDELLEDTSALDRYITTKIAQKMNMKINVAIVQGTGAGQPLGILNAPGTVSVAEEGSQTADTLVGLNVIKMYSRMYGPFRSGAVWLINQSIEPQLFTLMKVGKLDTGAADTGWGIPLYMPAGGISGQPYGTLFGRPVITTEACETLGDKGDIIFANLSQYQIVQKTGGIRQDVSIHLYFDYDMTCFRAVFRMAGQPKWASAISQRDGSNTLSAFVTLDARA